MDFQHRPGGKTGVGGVASASDANRDRRERLRQLALETIDLNKVEIKHFGEAAQFICICIFCCITGSRLYCLSFPANCCLLVKPLLATARAASVCLFVCSSVCCQIAKM